MIDLRSDTVTLPSAEMYDAMRHAPLGDDVFKDDPTVNELEALAAEVTGKAAALYVPSGTMGNLTALLTHAGPGHEVIAAERSHTVLDEQGGYARVAGLSLRTVPQSNGVPDLDRMEAGIRAENIHYPRTGLLWIEEPTDGFVVPLEVLRRLRAMADRHDLPVHMDGARIFNAALCLGVPVSEIATYADSVMFCVSKGLGAPVGSLLCGSRRFITDALRNRKLLGGGMRQAGVLAGAGLYAIREMSKRLPEDHENAKLLAEGLSRIPGLRLDREEIQTNIFFVHVERPGLTPQEFVTRLQGQGVLILPPDAATDPVRFVTHYGITAEDVRKAIAAAEAVLAQTPARA